MKSVAFTMRCTHALFSAIVGIAVLTSADAATPPGDAASPFDATRATHFADLALACVHKEFPKDRKSGG